MNLRHNTCKVTGACEIISGGMRFIPCGVDSCTAHFYSPVIYHYQHRVGLGSRCAIFNMEVSPLQSNARTSSDFSIESILSDRPRSEEGPSWLVCTRYQPPRLPRPTHVSRTRRSGRHARVPFTATQASALEAAYARAPYLAPPALRALAAALQLRDDRIKIWFQNRRARERREKCAPIAPPHSIALPAAANIHRPYLTRYWTQETTSLVNGPVTNESDCRVSETSRINVRTDLSHHSEVVVDEKFDDTNDWSDSLLDVESVAD